MIIINHDPIDCEKDDFQINGGLWDGYSLYQLYKEAHTPYEWHKAIFKKAKEVGVTIFSTPFDETAVELLEGLSVPAYKISSFELIDLLLIKRVAQTGKPMIMSTGMASFKEIEEAVEMAYSNGCKELIVLHCISAYPSPYNQANLATISDLQRHLNVLVGLSDHTLGTVVAVTSVALGACLIEKHFIIDKNNVGPDSSFSLEPDELTNLVEQTKIAFDAIGKSGYQLKPAEEASIKFRRSLYFVKDIRSGVVVQNEHVRRIRPGFGLPPKHFNEIIGRRAKKNIMRGTPVTWDLIE